MLARKSNREIYLGAAELIKQHGHAKWELVDDRGRMCLLGAIHAELYGSPNWPEHREDDKRAVHLVFAIT